jgi:hypothetical protein
MRVFEPPPGKRQIVLMMSRLAAVGPGDLLAFRVSRNEDLEPLRRHWRPYAAGSKHIGWAGQLQPQGLS